MSDQALVFNGINGTSGEYLLPPLTPQQITRLARGESIDPEHLKELKRRHLQRTQKSLGLKHGVDPKDLSQAGWGAIFAHNADPAVREALKELLDYRREQATKVKAGRYREFRGDEGYQPNETKLEFLARFKSGTGPVDPDKIPYYLLLVGDPESIPFTFQYQLDVQHAVGRIHFETLEEYANYARSVVTAEEGLQLPRRAVFFGPSNPNDAPTIMSAGELVEPLSKSLAEARKTANPDKKASWQVQTLLGEKARKQDLADVLGGDKTPALLFTASHGMGFDNGDARQTKHQGALLCQDWPGPQDWYKPLPPDFYFAGDDLDANASLLGLMSFHFACYGAGTPRLDDFSHHAFGDSQAIAPHAFVSRLPMRMLSHPKGGALATIGHVERAWSCSFSSPGAGPQLTAFQSTLEALMDGHPVGSAIEFFNERYAELSSELTTLLDVIKKGTVPDDMALAHLWTANNDARSFVIIGDPATRLCVAPKGSGTDKRPLIEKVVLPPSQGPTPASLPATALPEPAIPASQFVTTNTPVSPAGTMPVVAPFISGAPTSYGWFGSSEADQTRASLATSLRDFAQELSTTLGKFVQDVAVLEVKTYASDDMNSLPVGKNGLPPGARLRALTRISVEGDSLVCVPETDGEVDDALWAIHAATVLQAQTHRTQLLKTAVEAATGLMQALKTL